MLESPRHWYDQWEASYRRVAEGPQADGSHAGEALAEVEGLRHQVSWEFSPDWFLPFLDAACRAVAPALDVAARDGTAMHRLMVALAPALLRAAQLGYATGYRDAPRDRGAH